MGFLLDNANEDLRSILADGDEWSVNLKFTDSTLIPFTIKGLAFVHSQGYDSDFRPVITQNSHITFCEIDITSLGKVTRNSDNTMKLSGWIVEFTTGGKNYKCVIGACEPDTTLGIIKAQLTNYANN